MGSWRGLKKNSRIAIVAPGFAPQDAVQTLSRASQLLSDWGYEPVTEYNGKNPELMYAAPLVDRVQDFLNAWQDQRVGAIWCLRGGYGSLQMLPHLLRVRAKTPKMLIGFSDVTSLHQWAWQKQGAKTLMGPHLDSLIEDSQETRQRRECLQNFLQQGVLQGPDSVQPLLPCNEAAHQHNKKISGILLGGNLTTWQSGWLAGLRGNQQEPGHILLFEDWGERGYRIDRLLTSLRLAGAFRRTQAILFGEFLYGDEPGGQLNFVRDVLMSFANQMRIPVWSGFPHGHGQRGYFPWLHGGKITISRDHLWKLGY